jgi:phospholipid transport system substrate-binding protein
MMKTLNQVGRCFAVLMTALGLILLSSQALAQQVAEAPDALIKRVSQTVLDKIKNDKAIQEGDSRRLQELVRNEILPYVDFQKTTALAVGRHWRDATPEQQRQLSDEFLKLIVHTYAGALSQVKDQKLEFRPLRADPSDTQVEVRSRVVQTGREPIELDYRLEKMPEGWKIYDLNILGVWLTATYKTSFDQEIRHGGIDGLIHALAEKNRQLNNNVPTKKE